MNATYEQIVQVEKLASGNYEDLGPIVDLASQEKLSPTTEDGTRVLLLAIDEQNDFMEGGSLGVSGSKADTERLTRFIYRNMPYITKIMCSLDTHSPIQIFFSSWWVNSNGEHPEPYTQITYEDVKNGKWMPLYSPKESLEYLKNIESASKKNLCIWPYHCIHGTKGHNLEHEFSKMVYFHSTARKTIPEMLMKGFDPLSEMYGIFKKEYDPKDEINQRILNAIHKYDVIYIAGQAKSHCVLESIKQMLEFFETNSFETKKIFILEDCMSSIRGYEKSTEEMFQELKKKYGVNLVKSTDIDLSKIV